MRISDVTDESRTLQDASVTWVTAHTERVTFGRAFLEDDELRVAATIHVPCKHLRTPRGDPAIAPDGYTPAGSEGRRSEVRCEVHGFRGTVPRSSQLSPDRRIGVRRSDGRFALFYKGKHRVMDLRLKRAARRSKPEEQTDNPCVGAPCYTSDKKRGAACCRDFSVELALPDTQVFKEALLRARVSPFACKVKREDKTTMECEIISACGYLADDGITCVLHDRSLPNGQRAKPSLCYDWPKLGKDETGHGGCVLL